MTKTLEQYFCDWESDVFGFGYGSGEPHILPALKLFFEQLKDGRSYDYKDVEGQFGYLSAWLIINALCQADILEYGTSPRFGWLTEKGERLRDFIKSKTADELIELVCSREEYDVYCYRDACNCGPNGYEKGRVCQNPFWIK